MTEKEKKILEDRIIELNNEPGGIQAVKFIANCFPISSAVTSTYNEMNQKEINESLLDLFLEHDDNIDTLLKLINDNTNEPTKSSLSLLLGQTLGIELPNSYEELATTELRVVIHSDTAGEFKKYEEKGWIKMSCNHNQVMMGSGNRSGNDYEDLKRSYGWGIGFTIRINKELYE